MVALEFLDCMEAELRKLFEGMVFDNSTEIGRAHV